jgi:putative FmdB family regulatory protein
MPTYEYKCENGHHFEVIQRMADDPIDACQVCGAPVERVFHPVAVHFKGSGFYTTDYGSKKKKGEDGGGEPKSDSKGSKESSSGDKASKSDSSAKAASGSD